MPHLRDLLGKRRKKDKPADKLAKLVASRLKEAMQARKELERTWKTSVAFKEGSQWSHFEDQGRYLYNRRAPSWRVRLTANRMHSIIQTFIAKLTKNNPAWFVVPASSDPADEDAAKVGEALLEHFWQMLRIKRKTVQIADWMATVGKCFAHAYWDADAGDPMAAKDGSVRKLGDVAVEIVSPFEIYPDPLATDLASCRWLIRARTVYRDWVVETYDLDDDEAQKIKSDVDIDHFYKRSLQAIGGPVTRLAPDPHENRVFDGRTTENLTTLVEYFARPTAKHPRGQYAAYAGTLELRSGPLPYDHGNIPFVEYGIPSVGKFWPTALAEMLIPIQKEFNKTRSQMIENQNLMANPKWAIERDSLADADITRAPGEVLEFRRGASPPQPIQMPSLPGYVSENLAMAIRDMQEISGQHDVTRGTVPSGLRSGRAIAFLIEQDDTRLGPIVHNFESAMEELGGQLLALASEKYREKRTIQVLGKNREVLVQRIKGADLGNSLTVRVQAGSAFPYSRAAKMDEIMQLVEIGVLDRAVDKEQVLRALDVGQVDAIIDAALQDRQNAQWENDRLKKGKVEVVRPFDRHDVHIEEHDKFRKSMEYRDLPVEIQELFDEHVAAHEQFIAGAAQGAENPGLPGSLQPGQLPVQAAQGPAIPPGSLVPDTTEGVIQETLQNG